MSGTLVQKTITHKKNIATQLTIIFCKTPSHPEKEYLTTGTNEVAFNGNIWLEAQSKYGDHFKYLCRLFSHLKEAQLRERIFF